MVCELLDIRCWVVNEIVGSLGLAMVLLAMLYFIIASKNNFGFDATIGFSIPIILLLSIAIGGFNLLYAFLTVLIGLLVAWMFNKMIS